MTRPRNPDGVGYSKSIEYLAEANGANIKPSRDVLEAAREQRRLRDIADMERCAREIKEELDARRAAHRAEAEDSA